MENNCSHNRDDLVLFFYDELSEGEHLEMEARLSVCSNCRENLAGIESISLSVPRSPSIEFNESTLDAIRDATSKRILAEGRSHSKKEIVIRMPAHVIRMPAQARWSLALAAVVVAFFFGRTSIVPAEFAPRASMDLASSTQVSDIEYDVEQGVFQIQYESPLQSSIAADLSDSRVQILLGRALLDEENPGGRLSAARAVSEANFLNVQPDPELLQALSHALSNEPNDGIRLLILKALNSLHVGSPVSDQLKEELIAVLLNEDKSALRIEALQLLTRSELASIDLQTALQAASSDNNPFIRRQAETALSDFEQKGRLEAVQN